MLVGFGWSGWYSRTKKVVGISNSFYLAFAPFLAPMPNWTKNTKVKNLNLSTCFDVAGSCLPVGSKTLVAGSEAFPAGSETLKTGTKAPSIVSGTLSAAYEALLSLKNPLKPSLTPG